VEAPVTDQLDMFRAATSDDPADQAWWGRRPGEGLTAWQDRTYAQHVAEHADGQPFCDRCGCPVTVCTRAQNRAQYAHKVSPSCPDRRTAP
jgi:hypothetical protein